MTKFSRGYAKLTDIIKIVYRYILYFVAWFYSTSNAVVRREVGIKMDKIIPQDAFEAVVSAINRNFAGKVSATIEEIAQAAEVESWVVREMINALVMWDHAKVAGQDAHLCLR